MYICPVLVQWFGNLVTPKWWDDTWLNEGFSVYLEVLGVDVTEPDWLMVGPARQIVHSLDDIT